MKFVQRLLAASFLSLLITAGSAGHISEPIRPIPQNLFIPVMLAEQSVVIDNFKAPIPTEKPKITQPKIQPQAIVELGRSMTGEATWYCLRGVSVCHYAHSGGMYAAAGSELQIGDWRGRIVTVWYNGKPVTVTLIDSCQCKGNRIIDLYYDAFKVLGSPEILGKITVKVTWSN